MGYPFGFLFFFQKIPHFENSSWIFFPKYGELSLFKLIMTEVPTDLRNIFFHKIPPILKLEVGFFSDRKRFSQIFENWQKKFHLKLLSKRIIKKSENLFGSSNTPDFET